MKPGMKTAFVAIFLMASIGVCYPQNQSSPRKPINGVGMIKTCAEWMDDRRNGAAKWSPDQAWLLGYLSALDRYHPLPNFWGSAYAALSYRLDLLGEIDKICANSPDMYLGDAANVLWKNRGGIIDPQDPNSN